MRSYSLKEFCNNTAFKFGLSLGRENDITTGFKQLDDMLQKNFLNSSNVIGLAARPGMGITTFVLDIALNVAMSSGEEVIYFSLKQTKEKVFEKLIRKISGIDLSNTTISNMSEYEKVKLLTALQKLYNLKFTICNFADCDLSNIKSTFKMGRKPALVIIDDFDEFKAANKNDSMIKIKMLSRKLDLPFIICDKIFYNFDKTIGRIPHLRDFKENILLFDVVMFLHRKAYKSGMSRYDMSKSELLVSKNINGEIGVIDLIFKSDKCSFVDSES